MLLTGMMISCPALYDTSATVTALGDDSNSCFIHVTIDDDHVVSTPQKWGLLLRLFCIASPINFWHASIIIDHHHYHA